MKFDSEKIKKTTFPVASFSGYRKYDVDDFLHYVAKDYRRFEQDKEDLQEDIEMITVRQKKQEDEFSKERSRYVIELHEQKQRTEELEGRLKQLAWEKEQEATKQPSSTFQEAILISQETALEIERSAEQEGAKIIEEAHVERGRIIKEAKEEKTNLLKQAETSRRAIQQQANQVLAAAEQRKQEIEAHCQQELVKLEQEKEMMLQQTKHELSLLAEEMAQTKQAIGAAKREEINFRDTLIYDYKAALAKINDVKWQNWAGTFDDKLHQIQA
ncbi:DivIVA domain-containing protein [Enterococcus sp. AZ163]|uniref:DivIVA domain-containing protein n=1 Tax=Enterococcus sp. AZ163 TaxID=2774638 RepID=UPI003D28FF13